MTELNLREVEYFSDSKTIMFLRSSDYPTIYYQYEFSGTTKSQITQNITYIPIDNHWSLLIDGSIP